MDLTGHADGATKAGQIVFPMRKALVMEAARLVPVGLWSALWSRIPQADG